MDPSLSVALAVAASTVDEVPEDLLLVEALRAQGVSAEIQAWDFPQKHPPALTVIRSLWDYPEKLEIFEDWLKEFETSGRRLLNPPKTVRWNLSKTYLEELEEAGVSIPSTGWIEKGGLVHLDHVLELEGWDQAVVKPVVGLGGKDIFRTSRAQSQEDDPRFRKMVREEAVMVQEFCPEILDSGEVSLVYFGGDFSHAVEKKPAPNEFRIQEQYGGRTQALKASPSLLSQGEAVLEALESRKISWTYCRIDGIRRKGKLLVNEVELIEPSLYLTTEPSAAERFAKVLKQALEAP